MKKIVWIVVGLVMVIGTGLLIGRSKPQKESTTECTDHTETGEVSGGRLTTKGTNYTNVESDKSVQSADGQTGKSSPRLSAPVKALLGLDGKKHNYPSLLKMINELDADMSVTDVSALREMLNFPNDRFPEKMRSIEINAVKNDVLDKLLRQKDLPEGLGLQMVEMAGNAETDPVWRDYCIQFMTPFYERLTTEYTEHTEMGEGLTTKDTKYTKGDSELAAIHDAMFSALDERDATLAGTALIGLELLSRTHDEFDRETIVAKATEIASDEMASSASRLTALRLAAMTEGRESAVDAARSLAQTGETVLLRSAAIVTLGEVGTPDDRELLESYAQGENRQIAAAAKMALEKMDARN